MKAGALGGCGQVAGFSATEDAQAIAGDEVVNGIPQWAGHEAEDGEQAPWKAERHGDAQCGVTAHQDGLVGTGIDEGVELLGVETIGEADLSAEVRLQRSEMQLPCAVQAKQGLNAACAKAADTVEENQMVSREFHRSGALHSRRR